MDPGGGVGRVSVFVAGDNCVVLVLKRESVKMAN